uniref:ATP synthase c subunit lysine N-methyltransferase n=1 Tax=Anser cygnoides TaxID=8845 RepID=A0A8B9E6J0_ANSCY
MAFMLGISEASPSLAERRLTAEELTCTFKAYRLKPRAGAAPGRVWRPSRSGAMPAPSGRAPPPAPGPAAHLERLQPHEARLALLVLEDEEGPPILIKRQRPHGRHGCGGSQRPPTAPNGHPSTSRARPARRAVTQRAHPPAAPRLRRAPRRDIIHGGELMWRSRQSFLEAAGAPGAARRSRPRPPARRGGGWGMRSRTIRTPGGPQRGGKKRIRKDSPAAEECRADLLCSVSRKVIAAAKMGFKAVGYELNPWLVWYSRYRAWRDGVHHNTKFYISDLWKVSFSHYTNVVIFGVPQMMPQLEKKLKEELESNARIIACRFPFPCWIPDHTTGEGIDTVWAYDLKCPRGSERKSLETTPATES